MTVSQHIRAATQWQNSPVAKLSAATYSAAASRYEMKLAT